MRLRTLAAGVATLALALTACGDSETDLSGDSGSSGSAAYEVVSSPSFDSGSTMAKLNSAGKIKIGVKYDQPGIGNKNPSTWSSRRTRSPTSASRSSPSPVRTT